uniref:Uncharacterized protein n=1 Tax=Lepeophtheirus salmonis TaxID=72036 RepID=A0A0K2U149_LEPSM
MYICDGHYRSLIKNYVKMMSNLKLKINLFFASDFCGERLKGFHWRWCILLYKNRQKHFPIMLHSTFSPHCLTE